MPYGHFYIASLDFTKFYHPNAPKPDLSFDQIIAKFPHKAFPMIEGEPDYHIIHNMWAVVYVNASTLINTMGGGNHGYVGIIM